MDSEGYLSGKEITELSEWEIGFPPLTESQVHFKVMESDQGVFFLLVPTKQLVENSELPMAALTPPPLLRESSSPISIPDPEDITMQQLLKPSEDASSSSSH